MEKYYKHLCNTKSDINEHLPTLYEFAKNCSHITECGVRSFVSSYAFGYALVNNPNAKLIQVDPEYNQNAHENFYKLCLENNITNVFYIQSDLECPLEQTDLLFIDTWHIYGQLKRELNRWHTFVSKYIIMHDTTVDAEYGETLRLNWNPIEQSKYSNIPVHEICRGLWPAVEKFLAKNKNWKLLKRYENNNGLTILERIE